jgi:hypothetical protein
MRPLGLFLFLTVLVVSFGVGFRLGCNAGLDTSFTPAQPTHNLSPQAPQKKLIKKTQYFQWSALETTNYVDFVRRLRTIGCPERTITDIVRGELTRMYAPRFAEIARTGNRGNLSSEMQEKSRKRELLKRQIESMMYDQLKLRRAGRSAGVQFTAEEEEIIAEARSQFAPRMRDPTDPVSVELSLSNRAARLNFLSRYLTPEGLRYYKLDREGDAVRVDMLLRGMKPTKEEFLAVADAIEGKDDAVTNGSLQPEVVNQLQHVLRPERLALLLNLQRPEYKAIVTFSKVYQLQLEKVNELVQLRSTMARDTVNVYRQQVEACLGPRLSVVYLANRAIHPAVAP